MANIYEGMNVRQKLAKARLQFLNQKVKKSGKNMHLEFKYFELEDIVPPAIRIFARVGLTTDIDFTDENGAVMRVYNTDNSEEAPIEFRVPYREVKPIVSNAGKEVTNPMQALGSSITYLRRYLWMAVLDITEPDDIDATLGSEPEEEEPEIEAPNPEKAKTEKKSQKKQKAPATPAERKEAKIGLTEGFTLIPEGTHVFKITEVNYKEDFGKMEVVMQTAKGQKHIERFSLLNKDGEPNQGGLNAFSYFAKTALDDFTVKDIDDQELVGHFIRCEVEHEEVESNKTPGKMLKFARLGDKEAAYGFDEEEAAPAAPKQSKPAQAEPAKQEGKKPAAFDLGSLLG